jgi:hypothetical protein
MASFTGVACIKRAVTPDLIQAAGAVARIGAFASGGNTDRGLVAG